MQVSGVGHTGAAGGALLVAGFGVEAVAPADAVATEENSGAGPALSDLLSQLAPVARRKTMASGAARVRRRIPPHARRTVIRAQSGRRLRNSRVLAQNRLRKARTLSI
ncbi:hypothetical protein Rhe02_61220 [Rhizocola hellebori]|uniref:Uncharacterized protein n=1 Tax=Rhizocola hellebori TaxID=1392758 RepID=A0A8J3QCD9_9ACTN|nr:hypothetical protein Rhe02_61220 [Rhizocola hellebori]